MQQTVLERRKIGSLEVSLTGLGCNNFGWRIDAAQSARVVHTALDAGINYFDTADIYDKGHSEEFLGRTRRPPQPGDQRHQVRHEVRRDAPGRTPQYVRQAAEDSLRRLGTDYRSVPTPSARPALDDTLGALHELVRAGKVREIGCSNFSRRRSARRRMFRAAPASSSVQTNTVCSIATPRRKYCRNASASASRFCPFSRSPTASNGQPPRSAATQRQPGRRRFGPKVFTPENLDKVERLIRSPKAAAIPCWTGLFMAGSAARVASVIAGATSPEQVKANAAPLGNCLPKTSNKSTPCSDSGHPHSSLKSPRGTFKY